ncbi:hypothetical protein HMPREF9120_00892 [Neisseria sp. oral taxon 020 str. F0370]|nr:hypothetical protein HMPREF9120_00892 [Neisseria sp. oral taxon 020 str. F0370]
MFKTNPFRRPQTPSETACVGCVALPRTRSPNTQCMPAFLAHRSIRQTKQPAQQSEVAKLKNDTEH